MSSNLTSDQSSEHPALVSSSQASSSTILPIPQVENSQPVSSRDTSPSWAQSPPGFPHLANFIAQDKDKSTSIYRKFERLSARNLLYLESELSDLEEQLELQDREASGDTYLYRASQDWSLLKLEARVFENADPTAAEELKEKMVVDDETMHRIARVAHDTQNLTRQIEDTLKRYHSALKLQSEILALPPPTKRALEATRRVLKPPGADDAIIHGPMAKHLDGSRDTDLCVLATPPEAVLFTRLFRHCFSAYLQKNPNSKRRLEKLGGLVAGILPTIFIVGGIFSLYFVRRPIAKLLILCAFIVAFALSLGLLTGASRHEIFVGTAAYAAVLVVFVSGDLAASASATVMDERLGSATHA